jgi:hypothetical protein
VPARLSAILLIPVTVGLVMGGLQVKGSVDTWHEAEDAVRTARLVGAALTYSQRLVDERDISAAPLLRGDRKDPNVARARAATDRAAAAFDRAARQRPHRAGLERRLTAFRRAEPGLAKLRTNAYTSKLAGVGTEEGYAALQQPLMGFANELGLGTGGVTGYGHTVYAVSVAEAALSQERSIGMQLLVKPGPGAENLGRERAALSSYAYLERISTEEYLAGGTEADAAALSRAAAKVRDDAAKAANDRAAAGAKGQTHVPPPSFDKMTEALAALPGTRQSDRQALTRKGITEAAWWDTSTAEFDAYRGIESSLAGKAVNEAAGVADDARRSTFVTGAMVIVALLTALLLAGLMARQMSRSMRTLRTAAFAIAQQRLPLIVDQLSRTAPGRVDTRVRPLPISTRDEIGEVARAFDQVHREAVRLAAEQALLRGNMNAVFADLSRRNASLIDDQLALISDLESRETDPDQLGGLFRLDHLATRMRRNGENLRNLLVPSAKESGRSWDQPRPLVDVLRAASAQDAETTSPEALPTAITHSGGAVHRQESAQAAKTGPARGGAALSGGAPEPALNGFPGPAHAQTAGPDQAGAAQDDPAVHAALHQGEWAHQGSFQAAQAMQYPGEAESAEIADGNMRNRVGFTRSGPAPSTSHELTDAGLPRRGFAAGGGKGVSDASPGRPQPDARQDSGVWCAGREVSSGEPSAVQPKKAVRRSANDERWERAEALRSPRAAGVTPSGLPRRTPRASLVKDAAEQTPQAGPQVFRAPEDVRGRLSTLRRGNRWGHSDGSNSNGPARKDPNGDPPGPDTTYNQER